MSTPGPMAHTGDLVRVLRKGLEMTQDQVADRSGGKLTRVYVNKIEKGVLKANTDDMRAGLAAAFGLTRDLLAEYLDQRLSLEDVLRHRSDRLRELASGQRDRPILRRHPRWNELVRDARKIRPKISEEFFQKELGDQPFMYGPLENLDATLLADLARDLLEWRARNESDLPPPPQPRSRTAGRS